MVAQSAGSANRDLTWPALTGKREMRGSDGIGRHVACWIAEQLGYVVVCMQPIAKNDGRKVPYEKWGDAKPGREAGIASEYRSPFEIMRAKHFRLKCGVGILAGKSGLVVIDIDNEESWIEFVAGRDLPRTMALDTHSGRQLIFRDETGISFKTQATQLYPGVDVRGRGGLFVVYDPGQPERHFTDLTEPAELPDWLRAAIPRAGTRGHRRGSARGKFPPQQKVDMAAIMRGIPPGQHHERLRAASMSIVNYDLNFSDQAWFDLAISILERSNEGTDGKGNVRGLYTDDEIMGYLHSAQEKRRDEIAKKKDKRVNLFGGAELTMSAEDVEDKDVEWIWSRYIPRCTLVQLDGEKGYAKSFALADVVARATTGRAMPGEEEAICDPMHVFIFTEELVAQNKKKLRAAGADLSMVHYPRPDFREAIKRIMADNSGDDEEEDERDLELLLPAGSDLIVEMIREANAELVIWDPISHYVDANTVNVNSDPAVRRALEPLIEGLDLLNAAGIMVRHLNKDRGASARHRGTGTTAFQNIGRVHLVMGKLAEEHDSMFGLNMLVNNYTVSVKGTLTFDVVDSDVKLDNLGHMVGKVEWHDLEEDIDADELVRGSEGSNGKPGPDPAVRTAVKRILAEMGKIKSVWDAVEARQHIDEEMDKLGHDAPNNRTVNKARDESLITSKRVGVGKNEWRWPAQRVPRVRQ